MPLPVAQTKAAATAHTSNIDTDFFRDRAILAPTNEIVQDINQGEDRNLPQ